MKLKDMTDQGIIAADSAPPGTLSSVPPIEDFRISVEGILKLLKNLKPGKAAGPDKLKVGGKKGNRTEPNRTNGLYGAYENFRLLRYRVLPPSPNRIQRMRYLLVILSLFLFSLLN